MGTPLGSLQLPPPQTKEFADRIIALEEECRRELEQSIQSMQEIALLLTKTNSEVEKLSARELQLSNRVRDMEMHLENYGREDIRDLYNSSHETQLRLFMMRSQAEQLQNRQQHIKEYQEKLRLLVELLAIQSLEVGGGAPAAHPRGTTALGDRTQVLGGPSILTIIEAQEDERLRISRQIHDGPTQSLTNLVLRAEICERLIDRDVAEARAEIGGLKAMINHSLQDTRRLIFDLRPMILDDIGLVPTVRRYLTELGRIKGLQGEVSGPEHDLRLATTMQVALFRFIQTVVAALLVDGSAEHIDVVIERETTAARISIDASALDSDRDLIEERLEDPHLQHRLTLLGATLTSQTRSNRGFSVEILVPIPEEAVA
jgi:two-component system, NarL family, sensor histidine kinase DegS